MERTGYQVFKFVFRSKNSVIGTSGFLTILISMRVIRDSQKDAGYEKVFYVKRRLHCVVVSLGRGEGVLKKKKIIVVVPSKILTDWSHLNIKT